MLFLSPVWYTPFHEAPDTLLKTHHAGKVKISGSTASHYLHGFCPEEKKARRGRRMSNDLTEVENQLRSVSREQRRVQEYIIEIQQHLSQDETWLTMNAPATPEYQETLEELLALQAYIAEVTSHFPRRCNARSDA